MKIFNLAILVLLLVAFFVQNVLATDYADSELAEAENIVQQFLSYAGNVEDFENYWIVAKAVSNIDPVESRRKVQFLIDVCNSYTPTDKVGVSRLACEKIWHLGKKLVPNSTSKELRSKNSPLFEAVTKNNKVQ